MFYLFLSDPLQQVAEVPSGLGMSGKEDNNVSALSSFPGNHPEDEKIQDEGSETNLSSVSSTSFVATSTITHRKKSFSDSPLDVDRNQPIVSSVSLVSDSIEPASVAPVSTSTTQDKCTSPSNAPTCTPATPTIHALVDSPADQTMASPRAASRDRPKSLPPGGPPPAFLQQAKQQHLTARPSSQQYAKGNGGMTFVDKQKLVQATIAGEDGRRLRKPQLEDEEETVTQKWLKDSMREAKLFEDEAEELDDEIKQLEAELAGLEADEEEEEEEEPSESSD